MCEDIRVEIMRGIAEKLKYELRYPQHWPPSFFIGYFFKVKRILWLFPVAKFQVTVLIGDGIIIISSVGISEIDFGSGACKEFELNDPELIEKIREHIQEQLSSS